MKKKKKKNETRFFILRELGKKGLRFNKTDPPANFNLFNNGNIRKRFLNMFKVNNKYTRTTSRNVIVKAYLKPFFSVSIVDFE